MLESNTGGIMAWSFENAGEFLASRGIQTRVATNSNSGHKVLLSDYVSITDDQFERNAVTFYVYGTEQSAFLLELSLAKGNKEFLSQAEINYEDLLHDLILKATGSQSPQSLDVSSPSDGEIGDYTLRISDNADIEPHTMRAFIAKTEEFECGMGIRHKHLYPNL